MKTAFILMAQYDGLAIIPVELICRDYFRHLTVEKFLRKVGQAHPKAVALCGNCVSVCASAARQNNAPVSLAGVKPRAVSKASPTNAPTPAPRANNSSISA